METAPPYRVADLDLAEAGRKRICLAEGEMPGLMTLRSQFGGSKPLAGARISGCLHMTTESAVLIETLVALGASVRWCSCNILSTDDEAAAAVAATGVPVFAWKGETLAEYWWCVRQALSWPEGGPTMIVDDGADAALIVHQGLVCESHGRVSEPNSDGHPDEEAVLDLLRIIMSEDPSFWTRVAGDIVGASEETTTGVRRLTAFAERGELRFPIINVNDAVTKSKFDNVYGCRHSFIDGLNRAVDIMLAGKTVVICGFGDVGKGCASAARGQGAKVVICEVDPICALQAAMEGYAVSRLDDVLAEADVVVTATGCCDVITVAHMERMKHRAVIGNIGHFDNEIDVAGLASYPEIIRNPVKAQVDEWCFPDGHAVIVLSDGRLFNLGNANGHPSFVMSCSFSNQVLAQIDLYTRPHERRVYTLPKELDEHVARLHLPALGAHLTTLSVAQSEYLGLPIGGPYKPEHYRY
jgi:adenosylhomocysteinase